MKNKLLIVLVLLMSIILCACGTGKGNNANNSQNTQNNSESTPNNTETQEKEISVVGEWVRVIGDYYQTYTFHEDGTMTGYCTEPTAYKIKKSGDKNVLSIQTGEYGWDFYIVEENGSMKLNAWEFSMVPSATSGKTENSLTFPTVEKITSDSVIEPVEFFYLIQIGLLEHKTVSFDLENWFWNGETRSCNIAIDEEHFQLNDDYYDYMSYEFFKTAIYSPSVFFEIENENVTTATCPKTGKDCYKLSLTSNSCDSLGGSCDINIYLDKTTNQLTYVERIDTSGSNRGTYSTSNFTYSK